MIRGKTDKVFEGFCIFFSVLLALLCLYPLLYTLGVSLTSETEWMDRNGLLILFPTKPTFVAYKKIFGVGSYVVKALGVSLLRTVVGTVTSVAINALVGYVLSRDRFPGKQAYIYLLLFTIFFSGGLIPAVEKNGEQKKRQMISTTVFGVVFLLKVRVIGHLLVTCWKWQMNMARWV